MHTYKYTHKHTHMQTLAHSLTQKQTQKVTDTWRHGSTPSVPKQQEGAQAFDGEEVKRSECPVINHCHYTFPSPCSPLSLISILDDITKAKGFRFFTSCSENVNRWWHLNSSTVLSVLFEKEFWWHHNRQQQIMLQFLIDGFVTSLNQPTSQPSFS